MKQKNLITIIRKSCLTGRAVWIYQGFSCGAARKAYHRACKKELERVRHWQEIIARRKENITRLLADLMANILPTTALTCEQQTAARQLREISEGQPVQHEFYEHIKAERRRRAADRKLRGCQPSQKTNQNGHYVK